MGRLIDTEKFSKAMKDYFTEMITHHKYNADCVDCNADLQHLLDEQPTAYDVDKVVKQLIDYLPNNEDYLRQATINLAYAIEIVKHGGVSDDVCEWERGSSGYAGYPAYYSKCCTTNSNGLEVQTHIIADWKYCPYCGKKIKVVE